jgi:hypothetical protein
LPNWVRKNLEVQRVIVVPGPEWDGEKFGPLKTKHELIKTRCDILIPVILPSERQVFLMHIDIASFTATIYVATQYDLREEHSADSALEVALIHLDDSTLPNNVIESLPLVVIDLLKAMGYSMSHIEQHLKGEQVHVGNIERDEDVLVYLCSVAERLMFQKKINERTDNISVPKKELIVLARQKIVSAFVHFFS